MTAVATSGVGKLLSGSAVYLAGNIANAIIPFALLPVLTRFLAPDEYGQVAMFQTVIAMLAAFVGLNAAGAANRKVFDPDATDRVMARFIGACLQIMLVTALIILAVFHLLREPLSGMLGLPASWLYLAVLVSAASFVANLRLGQWQVRKQASRYAVFQVSQALVNALVSILLVVVLLQGAFGRVAAQALVIPVFAILALYLLSRDKLLAFTWNPDTIKEILRFGVPLVPHVAGIFLLNAVDRVVITDRLGLSETGIYMVAVQLTWAMAIVFDALNKAFVPWLFERLKRDIEEEKRQVVKLTYLWFVVVAAAAGIFFLIGDDIIRIIAGERYVGGGQVIGLLALGQAFSGMYLMVTNYIFYSKRTGRLSLVTIASGLLNVVLLLFLVDKLGVQGAALAFAISMFIRFLLTWVMAQSCHSMPWAGIFRR